MFIVRCAIALLQRGERWFASEGAGSAPAAEPPPMPATTRPLIRLRDGLYAEWCLCGSPPLGAFALVRTKAGRMLAMHLECLHERV